MAGRAVRYKYVQIPVRVLVLFVASLLFLVLFGSQKVQAAATADIPYQGDFSSNDMALFVADYGGSYQLNAPESVVKVFFTASSGTVTILDGNVCRYGSGGIDSISGDPSVVFRLARATAGESVDWSVSSATGSTFNCASRDLTLSISGLVPSTVPGHEGYYVAYFYANMWGADAISAFKLRTSSGYLSYFSGSGSRFALGQAYILPQRYANYKLTFAPQCSLQAGQTQAATIRWYDADQGNGNQDVPLGSQLVAIDPSGNRTVIGSWGSLPGGNAIPGTGSDIEYSYTFTAQGRYKYEWDFTNVQSQNGIQFQLPYDSLNYDITCNDKPVILSFTANCSQAQVRADTPTGNNYDARLLVNGADTTSLIQGNADGSTVTFSTAAWKDFSSRAFSVRVRDVGNNQPETTAQITVGPCLRFSCGQITTNPANPEPGVPFEATASFNVVNVSTGTSASIGSSGNAKAWYISLRITPGIVDPYQGIGSGTLAPGGGQTTISATKTGLTAPMGRYDAFWRVSATSGGAALSPPGTCTEEDAIEVTEKPFFRVVSGDIAAGVTTAAPGCPGWGTSSNPIVSLNAWNNGVAGATNVGAGTNLAVISGTGILGVASAQGRTSLPQPIIGLSFSSFSLNGYGGFYPNDMPCPTDYANTRSSTSTTPVSGTFAVPSTNSAYYANAPLVVPGAAAVTVGLGSRPVVYVDGDVYINNNILLAAGATTVSDMPNFYLIVRGNIWIDPTVSQLDGVYIAQPELADANGDGDFEGRIYTCSSGFAPPSDNMINDDCRTELTVFGAFIAKELKFYRSFGSLSGNVAAETFNTTPNTWLAAPCVISGCSENGADGYDAITSLPPVL